MEAWYRAQALWRLVSGASQAPKVTAPPKEGEEEKFELWQVKVDKAAGIMYLMVEPTQRVHFRGIKDDAVKMWKALEEVHMQKRAGTRFNAYDDLFSIRKRDDEDLQSLINRVDDAVHRIRDLRSTGFTLDKLDDELASMMLIRALPDDYNGFVSSLLLKDDLDKFSVQNVFVREDTQRRRRQDESPAVGTALAAASGPCTFCGILGHTQDICRQCAQAKELLQKERANRSKNRSKNPPAQSHNTTVASAQVTEFAGNASALSTPSSPTPPNFNWLADTGATSHMTPHRHWVRNYSPLRTPIRLADNSIIYSSGVGTVVFNPVIGGKASQPVEFTRVLHVPSLQNNLLSCLYLTKHKGIEIHIDSHQMDFIRAGRSLFCAPIGLTNCAHLSGSTEPLTESANWVSTLPLTPSLWHRRCCHHNLVDITKMHKEGLVTGMTFSSSEKPDIVCEPCLAGKMHSNPFPSSSSRALKPLELVHMDLHGPLPPTREGYRYWLTFIDDASSHRAALRLKRKSDTFEGFKTYKSFAENQLQAKIKELQDDKGGEFMSNAFLKFTDECGIHRRHTTRNRPQQNGVAERANRTMGEDISAMLYEAQLPPSLWGEALNAQIHIWNLLPTSTLKGMTPHEAWFKRKPDVSHLRVWGCLAYVFIQKDKRKSLQPHMEKCVFMGYPSGYKGWLFYNPNTQKYIISERAEFDERIFPGLSKYKATSPVNLTSPNTLPLSTDTTPSTVLDLGGDSDEDDQTTAILLPVLPPVPEPAPPVNLPPAPIPPAIPAIPPVHQAPLRRTQRVSRPPGEWWTVKHPVEPEAEPPVIWSDDEEDDAGNDEHANSATDPEPRTFKQAMHGHQSDRWREAATLEYNTLIENGTWEIVDLPYGEKAIGSGWVFKVKHNVDGSIERFKARLVAKGYSQRPGLDYNESFAPTFRPATLRIIMALAAVEDLELRSVDITSAFTNGDLDEEIYMRQPEGFHVGSPNQVCRLRKSLYGLKQSARQWNKKLHSVLTGLGFKRIESDRSVYIYSNGEVRIIVPIYIDDITLASKSSTAIDKYVQLLSEHFKCRDLGPTRFLLGVAVERDRPTRALKLHQHQFILELLEKFGMSDCKPVQTPLPPKLVLSHSMSPSTQEEQDLMSEIPYLSAVGSLQYLAMMTRPDIAHSVAYLARFNANPGLVHWKALKHLFRYVKGTIDHKLTYQGDLASKELFLTYSDASHGDCVDTGRSTAGYVTMMAGGAVGWYSKLQTIVALSTTEAEYMAAVEAGKEIAWMRNILSEFGYGVQEPSTLKMDNQSAITVSKNPEHHGRMKHLDLRLYWLRDKVEHGMVNPDFIPTGEMLADCLTKCVPAPKVRFCREKMGVLA